MKFSKFTKRIPLPPHGPDGLADITVLLSPQGVRLVIGNNTFYGCDWRMEEGVHWDDEPLAPEETK